MKICFRLTVGMLLCGIASGSTVQAQGFESVVVMQLVLKNAARVGSYAEIGRDMRLNIIKKGDTWLPVGGQALSNKGLAWGFVESGAIDGNTITLKVSYWQPTDPVAPGGRGVYDITMTRNGGVLTGAYTGVYYGENYCFWFVRKAVAADKYNAGDSCPPAGAVTGTINESQTPRKDFTPPAAGEHPRILFRYKDPPLLQAKAMTPFGRRCYALMDSDAVGLGVKYQLANFSGDFAAAQQYAARSADTVMKMVADFSNGDDVQGRAAWGKRLEAAACAFDLCYDAWSPAFRNRVAWYIVNTSKVILDFQGDWRGKDLPWAIDWYAGGWYAGVGFGGMALMDEQYPRPSLFPWYGDGQKAPAVPPAAGLIAPAGLPVTTLAFRDAHDISLIKEPGMSGVVPMPKYLYITGLTVSSDSLLAPLGGNALIGPKPGDLVAWNGVTRTWDTLGPGKLTTQTTSWTPAYQCIDIAALVNHYPYTVTYLYAVIENDAPRWVEFQHGIFHITYSSPFELEYYLNGVKRMQGDFAYLEKGTYPLLVVIPTFNFPATGAMNIAPRIVQPAENRRTRNLEFFDYELAQRNKYIQAVKALGMGSGEPYFLSLLHRGRGAMDEFFRLTKENATWFPRATCRAWTDNMIARWGQAVEGTLNVPANPDYDIVTRIRDLYQSPNIPATKVNANGQSNYQIYGHLFGFVPDSTADTMKSLWKSKFNIVNDDGASELIAQDPVYALLKYPLAVEVAAGAPLTNRAFAATTLQARMTGQGTVRVCFTVNGPGAVTLTAYDMRGCRTARSTVQVRQTGARSVTIDANRIASGARVVTLTTEHGAAMSAMIAGVRY